MTPIRLLLVAVMLTAITLSGNAFAGHHAKRPAFDLLGDRYFVKLSFSKDECYDGRHLLSAHIANESTNQVEAYQFVVEQGCINKAYVASGEFRISSRFAAFGVIVESGASVAGVARYTRSLYLIAFDRENGAREIFTSSKPDSDSNTSIFVSPVRTLGVKDLILRTEPAGSYPDRAYGAERRYQWNGERYVRSR